MAFIQVPADGVGKQVETNTPDGTNHRQVVSVGDKTTAANTLAINASGQITSNINGVVSVRPTDGTNQISKTFDIDTSGSTHEYVEGVVLRKSASGGSVELGTATNPLRVDTTSTTAQTVTGTVAFSNSTIAVTNTGTFAVQATLAAETTKVIGTVNVAASQTIAVTNTGTFAVQATLAAETTKVIGVTRTADGAGNLLTSTGNALDVNLKTGSIANTAFGITPATSGGLSISHLVTAASTNAANIKASAGQVFGWSIYNNAAYPIYVKFHNTAGAPTAGAGVVHSIGIQAGTGRDFTSDVGIAFSTGIAISVVKDIADAGTTAVAASDAIVEVYYK